MGTTDLHGRQDMVSGAHTQAPYYFIPHPSKWPAVGALALIFFGFGLASWFNGASFGPYLFWIFVAIMIYMLVGWFSTVARESERGLYSDRVDVSFRWSMSWFIFSEVMFFGAFFGALFWLRAHSVPDLGNIENALLWPDFKAVWPNVQAGVTASPAGTVE